MPNALISLAVRIVILAVLLIGCSSPAIPMPLSTPSRADVTTSVPAAAASPVVPTQSSAVQPVNTSRELSETDHWGDGTLAEVEWLPDGKSVAVAAGPGIYILQSADMTQQHLIETVGIPSHLTLAPNGSLMGWHQAAMYNWRTANGQATLVSNPERPNITDIVFSPDAQQAVLVQYEYDDVAGQSLEKLKLWDLASDVEIHALYTTTNPVDVHSVAFSPDGKLVAASLRGDAVRFWDTASGQEIAPLVTPTRGFALAFSPDGRLLAISGVDDHTAVLWDMVTGKQVANIDYRLPNRESSEVADALIFSPDGQMLAISLYGTNQSDNYIWLWSVAGSHPVATLVGDADLLRDMAFSPDSRTLATVDIDDLRVWDTVTGSLRQARHHSVYRLPDGPAVDGDLLGIVTLDGVKLLDIASGQEKSSFEAAGNVLLSPNGPPLVFEMSPGKLTVKDALSGEELRSIDLPGEILHRARFFSMDGDALASSACQRKQPDVIVWDLTSGEELGRAVGAATGSQCSFAISPDKRTLVVKVGGKVAVYSLPTGQAIKELKYGIIDYSPPVFSADGRWLAYPTRKRDGTGTVYIYDTATYDLAHTLTMPPQVGVVAVALSADGRLLATSSGTRVDLWEVDSGQSLGGISTAASSLQLALDGKRLITSGWGVIRVWEIQ